MNVTVYSNEDNINWGVTGDERIVQNVRNILRTRLFEVPFMRGLGLDADFIDSSPQTMRTDLATAVMETINLYEPRATVLDVNIISCDENGEYVIAVELEV